MSEDDARGRWVAIDLGDRRVGLAISDPTGTIASPVGFIERRAGKRPPLMALLAKAEELEARGFVVGLPLDGNGDDTPRALEARRLALELEQRTGLPVRLVDERFTTAAALRAIKAMEGSTRGRKGDVDAMAATMLLQHALRMVCLLYLVLLSTVACGTPNGAEVRLTIRKGSPFREAAESLAVHKVIASGRLFAVYAKLRGHDRSLRYGTYVLRRNMSWEQALDALRLGRGIVHLVSVPEGFTIARITPSLADALDVPVDSVAAAVRDTALLHRLDLPTQTVEGYLAPDTYIFPEGTSARGAIRTMVDRFEERWKPAWTDRLSTIAMSRHAVVTLASIVEMEVQRSEERPVVAAVYLNRMKAGMLLQADPTVQYALGKRPGRVYLRDLRVKSPYNTYRVPGLPPGPIASPSMGSIEAVLFPAKVPYRFFVAHPDGHHEFRRTYREHLEAIRLVRAAMHADSIARAAGAGAHKDSVVHKDSVAHKDSALKKDSVRPPR